MKHNLPNIIKPRFITLALTLMLLLVNVFEGMGSNNGHFLSFSSSLIQVSSIYKDSVLNGVKETHFQTKTYRIQVCALRNKIANIQLLEKACGQGNLIEEEGDSYYKYLTPGFTKQTLALKAVNELRAVLGFEGSFIVVYLDGKRVGPRVYTKSEQILSLSQKSGLPKISKDEAPLTEKMSDVSLPVGKIKSVKKDSIEPSASVREIKKNSISDNASGFEKSETLKDNNLFPSLLNFSNRFISSNLIVFILLFFSVGFLILVLFLILYRFGMARKRRKAISLSEVYAETLVEYLSELKGYANVPELFLEAGNAFKKDILIAEMVALCSSLTIDSVNKIRDLYLKLELDFYSFQKLDNRKWSIQAMGIHELAALDARNEADSIEAFINHPNPVLRHEAIVAIVRLRPSDPFGFLDRLTVQFTKRDQVNAYAVLQKYQFPIPEFSRWFDSFNPSVVQFAVEMASLNKQTGAAEHFDKLLRHSYEEVRACVIEAIGDMHLTEFSTRLIPIFNDEHEKIQMLILQTMGKLEDVNLLNFLSDLVLLNTSMRIRLEAAKALISTGPQGLTRIQTLLLNENSDISYIYNQILGRP